MAGRRPNDVAFDPEPYDYSPHQHYNSPYQQPAFRDAPPNGPPPAYYRVLNRTYSGSLRPILLLSCFVSLCYLLLLGIQELKLAGETGIDGRYHTFLVVQGALFLAAAGVEVLGLVASYMQRLQIARLYSWLSLFAYAAVVASQILAVVVLFAFKSDVLSACSTYYQGQGLDSSGWWWDDNSGSTPMSAQDALTYCQTLWSKSRTWDIIWLLVTCILGALFVLFGFAYARQLQDPKSVRTRIQQQHLDPSGQMNASAWNFDRAQNYDIDYRPSHDTYPPTAPQGFYAPPRDAPPEYKRHNSTDKCDLSQSAYPRGPDSSAASSSRPQSRYARAGDDYDVPERRRISDETLKGESTRKVSLDQTDGEQTPQI